MHELALGQAIVESIGRRADGREARQVTVRIGHLRQVVPDSLQFAWEMLTDGTELVGCLLEIDHVPAAVRCRSCGASTTLDLPILQCASCEGFDVELVSGEEFLIASIDLAEPPRDTSDRPPPGSTLGRPTMPRPTLPRPTLPRPNLPRPTLEVS